MSKIHFLLTERPEEEMGSLMNVGTKYEMGRAEVPEFGSFYLFQAPIFSTWVKHGEDIWI